MTRFVSLRFVAFMPSSPTSCGRFPPLRLWCFVLVRPMHLQAQVQLTYEWFSPSLHPRYEVSSLLWLRLTSCDSLLLRVLPFTRSHGISRHSFLVYLPKLPAWVTIAFGASRLFARLPAMQAFVFGSCPSGYDFAMASSLPHLTV